MKKLPLTLLFFLGLCNLYAQKEIIKLESEITNPYKFNINVKVLENIENRPMDYGFVKNGVFSKRNIIGFNNGLENEFERFFQSKFDSTLSVDTSLIILINKFQIAEKEDVGLFNYNADYFLKKNNSYQHFISIDKVFEFYGNDASNLLLRNLGDTLLNIQYELFKHGFKGLEDYYTLNEIQSFDSVYKTHLPIFQVNEFKRGVYLSWNEFKMHKPNFDTSFLYYPSSNKLFYSKSNGRKGFIVHADSTFAICSSNTFYFSDGYKFYKSTFENGNFYVTIKVSNSKNGVIIFPIVVNAAITIPAVVFGLASVIAYNVLFASTLSAKNINMQYKLNYRTGKFMPYKIIPTTSKTDDEFDENGKYKTK